MKAIQIIAATVLAVSLLFNWYQTGKVETLQLDVAALTTKVSNKQAVIDEQAKEIKEMPARYIETTRAMDKEICLGLNQIDKVMSMTSTRNVAPSVEAGKEVKNDKAVTVDIDDRLPDNLIKLLNED